MRCFSTLIGRTILCLTWLAIGAIITIDGRARAIEPETLVQAEDPIQRGRYLVTVMDCNGCHTPFVNGEPDMSRMLMGHPQGERVTEAPSLPTGWDVAISNTNTAWAGPWGISFTTNLTPDRSTGIGSWTDEAFLETIRTGKHLGGGRDILPPMPWRMYASLTDFDLKAMFAYLMTIPAISNQVPQPILAPGNR